MDRANARPKVFPYSKSWRSRLGFYGQTLRTQVMGFWHMCLANTSENALTLWTSAKGKKAQILGRQAGWIMRMEAQVLIKVSYFSTQWGVSNNGRIHGDQSTRCSRISHITLPCHLFVGRIVSLRWQKPSPLSAPWDPHLWHSHPYLNNLNGGNKKCPGPPHLANLEDALLLFWFFER